MIVNAIGCISKNRETNSKFLGFSLLFSHCLKATTVSRKPRAQGTHMYHKTMYFVYGSVRCPIKALRKFCCNNLPGKSHAPFSIQQACMAQIKVELINLFSHVHVLFRDHYRNERIVMTRLIVSCDSFSGDKKCEIF